MTNKIITFAAALLLGAFLAACGDPTATPVGTMGNMPGMDHGTTTMKSDATMGAMTPDAMTVSLQNLSGAAFETSFMQEMIAHHQSAIEMANLVPTNTKRPELIALGKDIVAAQSSEITQMTGWLAQWYTAKPLPDMMSAPGMMAMMGDMAQLKSAKDAAFDKQFISMMSAHHQAAVSMAQLAQQKATHTEIKTLAQNIISAQSREIGQMQGWQGAWFT